MKIRIFSDLHVDVNQGFPFSIREKDGGKDTFTLVAGDVSGNVKLTAKWMKENIHNGMFVVGNHDPSYNDLGWTIKKQKQFLADKFPLESSVTFLDESVGVVSKEIPGTNVLVVGTTLYTDYEYASDLMERSLKDGNEKRRARGESARDIVEVNMMIGARGLNDFRLGHVEDEFDDARLKQRLVRPDDYRRWFEKSFNRIKDEVESHPDKDIVVMTHHCPTPRCISQKYIHDEMNASYISDLEWFIFAHPNIKAWCCGHVHARFIEQIGENKQWIICNPRGYEKAMETGDWNPNTFLDTDTWEIETTPFKNKKLMDARRKFANRFFEYAAAFIV